MIDGGQGGGGGGGEGEKTRNAEGWIDRLNRGQRAI